jgi:hypothetical protein
MNAAPALLPTAPHKNTRYTGQGTRPENDITGFQTQMSQSKVLSDIDAFRRNFALVRMKFLRENFRRPEQVAEAYGVRFQSALNWWNGDNAASGAFVAEDFRLHPESAARHYCRGRAA